MCAEGRAGISEGLPFRALGHNTRWPRAGFPIGSSSAKILADPDGPVTVANVEFYFFSNPPGHPERAPNVVTYGLKR